MEFRSNENGGCAAFFKCNRVLSKIKLKTSYEKEGQRNINFSYELGLKLNLRKKVQWKVYFAALDLRFLKPVIK